MEKRDFLLRGETAAFLWRSVARDLPQTVLLPFFLLSDAYRTAPQNAAELLCLGTPENRALLALAGEDVPSGASDFELFRAFCAAYRSLAGHPLHRGAWETLTYGAEVAQTPAPETCDALWCAVAERLEARRIKTCRVFAPDALFAIEKTGFSDAVAALSAAYGVAVTDVASLETALNAALDAFTAAGGRLADHGRETLTVFVRPDPYHAGEALAAALAGRVIDRETAALWRCQLARILGRAYAARHIPLLLHTGKGTAELLAYLSRERALPQVVSDADAPCGAAMPDICCALAAAGEKNIPSGGFFGGARTAALRARIRRVAREQPLGALAYFADVRAGGAAVAEELFFRRALCDVVGGWVRTGRYPAADAPALIRAVCYENAAKMVGK